MDWRMEQRQKRKYLAAQRLGLLEALREAGWAGLSAKDSGRIGAEMRREAKKQE